MAANERRSLGENLIFQFARLFEEHLYVLTQRDTKSSNCPEAVSLMVVLLYLHWRESCDSNWYVFSMIIGTINLDAYGISAQ